MLSLNKHVLNEYNIKGNHINITVVVAIITIRFVPEQCLQVSYNITQH